MRRVIDGCRFQAPVAAWTGYRKGEIGSLTASSFELGDEPTVTVEAAYSKRRRRDTQVLHPGLATRVREWIAAKNPEQGELLFPVLKRAGAVDRKTSKMMRLDLQAARQKWREESPDADRGRLEKTDFLRYKDSRGRFADFHANTFINYRSRAGVSPKLTQTLARHSTIDLTMNVYNHTTNHERRAAIEQLTSAWECAGSARESRIGISGQEKSSTVDEDPRGDDAGSSSQGFAVSEPGTQSRGPTRLDRSEAAGTRTLDLRIKSPLLYRLSYSLNTSRRIVFNTGSGPRVVAEWR